MSIAIAALSYVGVKGNYGDALKIASSMPTGGLPALAVAGGGQMGGGAGAGTGVLLGPSTGSIGAGGAMMSKLENERGGAPKDGSEKATDPAKEPEEIKQKLESTKLSGKAKQALRARKRELQEQLGQTSSEPVTIEDTPAPTRFKQRASGLSGKEAATDIPSWAREWPTRDLA